MKSRSAFVLVPLALGLMAGCAENGALTTGSLNPSVTEEQAKQVAAAKQACATLATQIEGLNKDGISDKVEKAAAKKYKMKTADLAKANELNKANAEFQAKCSNYPATVAALPKPEETAAADAKAKDSKDATAAKAPPPVPPRKSAAATKPAEPNKQASNSPQPAPVSVQQKTAPAPVKAAAAATRPQTATVASAETEAAQPTSGSTMESSPTVSQPAFGAPRLSATPVSAITTTTGTP